MNIKITRITLESSFAHLFATYSNSSYKWVLSIFEYPVEVDLFDLNNLAF